MAEKSSPPGAADADSPADTEPRRDFLIECAAVGIGGFVGVVPVAAGMLAFLDPWNKKDYPAAAAETADDGFVRVTPLAAVPEDAPRRFPVFANLIDAWTVSPNQPVGAVYMIRAGEVVTCFNAICPHAGCFVNFSADRKEFSCPCHESFFSLTGEKGHGSPSPRNLDKLDTKLIDDGGTKVVLVDFKNFLTGRTDQVAK